MFGFGSTRLARRLAAILFAVTLASPAWGHGEATPQPGSGVDVGVVSSTPLANVPGHSLTAVTVDIAPGASAPAHHHAGFVFVYVLRGAVRSQLNDAAAVDYPEGASWVEPPGTTHTLTANTGATPARILAVFVAPVGATLTTPGKAAPVAK